MKNILFRVAACCLFILVTTQIAMAKTILYVPADDRPVSLEYAVDTVKAAKIDILVPPAEYLAGRGRLGDTLNVWQWVKENADKADAMVLSADTLIYGGLVDSRIHNFNDSVLEWRFNHIIKLREINPNAPIYVFSTIMRSPKASLGEVEPLYYETYGSNIFQLTALQDKAETTGLTMEEQTILRKLEKTVPNKYISDWMERRNKNFKVNTKLIDLLKNDGLDYLLIGRDDTSPFSQSHKESRMLSPLLAELPANKYATFPGADQLGIVLLARAYNYLTDQTPIVEIKYALGAGEKTVASYEDQPIGGTIVDHIRAAGGVIENNSQHPDLVLAVNTPLNNWTEEAESFNNLAMITANTSLFVKMIENNLKEGKTVAVADVAFANGADNSLMRMLFEHNLLDKLGSYSGWNTASNTLGYTIAQGMMAKSMPDKDRKRLLAIRYLDDWAYQANIRKELYAEVLYPKHGNAEFLNGFEKELTIAMQKKTEQFARQYLWIKPDKIKVTFPWNRIFENRVEILD